MWTLFRAPRGQGSRKGGAGRQEGVSYRRGGVEDRRDGVREVSVRVKGRPVGPCTLEAEGLGLDRGCPDAGGVSSVHSIQEVGSDSLRVRQGQSG